MFGQFLNLFLIFSVACLCQFATAQACTDFVECKCGSACTPRQSVGQIRFHCQFLQLFLFSATTCGGNVIGDSGIIRYNHSAYGNNTGCFWLIRSNINSNIEVRLLEDTFSSNEHVQIGHVFMDGEIGGNMGSMV